MPDWVTGAAYSDKIQSQLSTVPLSAKASDRGVSKPYTSEARAGKRHPHPRQWQGPAQLVVSRRIPEG